MVENEQIIKYSDVFKRTKIITDSITDSGYSFNEITDFIMDKISDTKSLLIVVNTKRSAERIYREILNKNIDKDLPYVYADKIRVAEVLNNLISNAIKYTDKGIKVYPSIIVVDKSFLISLL